MNEWNLMSQIKGKVYCKMFNPSQNNHLWFGKYNKLPRNLITLICRLKSNHTCTEAHLFSKGIVQSPYCSCGEWGDINHYFFNCRNHKSHSDVLINNLTSKGFSLPISIEIILNKLTIETAKLLYNFVKNAKIKI